MIIFLKDKKIVWKLNLDQTSIFSCPVCDNIENLFVTTLGGNLFCLNKDTGFIKWKFELDKPTFTSPIIFNSQIFLGTCGGIFYAISFDQKLVKPFC